MRTPGREEINADNRGNPGVKAYLIRQTLAGRVHDDAIDDVAESHAAFWIIGIALQLRMQRLDALAESRDGVRVQRRNVALGTEQADTFCQRDAFNLLRLDRTHQLFDWLITIRDGRDQPGDLDIEAVELFLGGLPRAAILFF